ncbi:MAG: hypothetical protein U0270_10825 [Labilithrix sp.]
MKLRTLGSLVIPALLAGCFAVGCTTKVSDDETAGGTADLTAERAADATGRGPLAIADGEYKFDATTDPDVLADRKTEVWGHMWRPKTLAAGERHPLIVFLHGNHGTCGIGSNPRSDNNVQYTTQGTCPPGYVVTPNHMGYAYIAERLASWGYYVVSINANRGITAGSPAAGDGGLNLARGRLVLKHLQLLSQWDKNPGSTPSTIGADLANTIDFSEIGMMGHSRGGEGVRAAYNQYLDQGSQWPSKILSPLGFKGIFEIGPVDGQTSRVLDAQGVSWNVILPMCDGDVSNLQGMKPFDRALAKNNETTPTPKGMFGVWGANHNYFNTEWQESDSSGCRGAGNVKLFETSGVSGSAKQQQAGLHALMGFFRGTVGKNKQPAFLKAYDPAYGLPESLETVTHIGRAYADSASTDNTKVLENFAAASGVSLSGAPMAFDGATITHGGAPEHDAALKAGLVSWTAAGQSLEIPVGNVNAADMATLDVRVSLKNVTASVATPTSFSIALVNADGSVSQKVSLSSYLELVTGGHVMLDTARIPLKDFRNANLAGIKSVKFMFDETATGQVYLASLRVSKPLAPAASVVTPGTNAPVGEPGTGNSTHDVETGNVINDIRTNPESEDVEIELTSPEAFVVNDEMPNLLLGSERVQGAGYATHGDTHNIVFKLTKEQFANVKEGSSLKVEYGTDVVTRSWKFGAIDKSMNH